jgi:hypothetical protein
MVARVSLNTLVQSFNLIQNGQALQTPVLGTAAGRDGVLSQQEARSLQNVLVVNKDTKESTSLFNLMNQNNIAGITLDLSSDILGTPDLSASAVPIAEINKGFITQQNGKRVKASVLQQAAGTDGILTIEEAAELKNVIVTNKQTRESLNLADCMAANGVSAIDLNNPNDPPGAKGVPIAELAKAFSAEQNGQPVELPVLLKAAGKDGLLTVKEAKKLDDVILTNNETGESLNLADCMVKNGVASIDLNEPETGVPLADLAAKFAFIQNGTDVSTDNLLAAAGEDKILSQDEAEVLQNVIVINNETGKTLNLADCMKANNVKAIDLRAITPVEETPPTDDGTDTTDDTDVTPVDNSSFRQQLIQMMQQMLEMIMQLFFQS